MGLFDSLDLVEDTDTSQLKNANKKAKKKRMQGLSLSSDILNDTKDEAIGHIDTSVDQALPYLQQGLTPYQDLFDMGQQGIEGHWNLINNPDSIFDSELYQSRERAGIDSLNRLANSRGMLASGNNSQDIIDYMRQGGLDYFNTLANQYSPYFGLATNAAGGLASGNRAIADLYSGAGTNRANIATGIGGQLAGNTYGTYNNIAQDRIGYGENMTNIGMYDTAQDWNALMGLGNLVVGGAQAAASGGAFGTPRS